MAGAQSEAPPVSTAGTQVAGARSLPPSVLLPVDAQTSGYEQQYPLSCEMAALHIALRLLGVDLAEETMRPYLPRNDDPDLGFRGNMDADQTLDDYGVHAKGLLRLLETLRGQGLIPRSAQGRLVHALDEMRAALVQHQPVVAWIPLELMPAERHDVKLDNGKTVHLIDHEHTVALRGYDATHVMALDPFDGSTPTYDANAFAQAMALFDDPGLAIST